MNKRKLKIYFQTKNDFLDDFLPKGSLCIGGWVVQKSLKTPLRNIKMDPNHEFSSLSRHFR